MTTVFDAANMLANNYQGGNVWTFTRRNAPRLTPRRKNAIEYRASVRMVESLAERIIMRRAIRGVEVFARAMVTR